MAIDVWSTIWQEHVPAQRREHALSKGTKRVAALLIARRDVRPWQQADHEECEAVAGWRVRRVLLHEFLDAQHSELRSSVDDVAR